ncbi:winged helix-turn-helix domain-containing protein, partial [Escherichia coli]|uniref:winged helix-turn-helix domain-containing protein n=1 Tax=Escherichia coli TaxID=562 RepID=UPI003D2ED3F7
HHPRAPRQRTSKNKKRIILISRPDSIANRHWFEAYFSSPPQEMARMQALMRRNSGLASQVISLPPFQVDLSRRELSINDEVIKLTAFEYTIMETLIRNNGKVVSKDSLMLQLYPDAELRESHTIDVLMGRLRKKIQAQYPQEVITTVRGQGYLFELR